LFFALWPGANERATLFGQAAALKKDAGGRATRAEKLHMTLVFLGDVEQARMAQLEAIARRAAVSAFALRIERTGYWPRQKIVWAAPQTVPVALLQLVSELESGLRADGFRLEDRPWRSHITLLRDARRPSLLPDMALDWHLSDFVLAESADGVYRVIGRWNLAAI